MCVSWRVTGMRGKRKCQNMRSGKSQPWVPVATQLPWLGAHLLPLTPDVSSYRTPVSNCNPIPLWVRLPSQDPDSWSLPSSPRPETRSSCPQAAPRRHNLETSLASRQLGKSPWTRRISKQLPISSPTVKWA